MNALKKMTKVQKILVFTLLGIVALGFIKDIILKSVITSVGSNMLGAPVHISSFSLGIITQKVDVKGLKVYNPPQFPKEPLVDVPQIKVNFDVPAFLSGKIHLPLVIFNMKEMVLIRNKEGHLNVDSLKVVEKAKEEKQKTSKEPVKEMAMQIDLLKLNIERVILKDYSKGTEYPIIEVYDIALKDKEFKNLKSSQEIATLVMMQAMGPTAIKSAGVYAAATLLGVGFLPAGVAGVFLSQADSVKVYATNPSKAFDAALGLIKKQGVVSLEDRQKGEIKGNVNGHDIQVKITSAPNNKTEVSITAKKMMVPKASVAGGLQYQLEQLL